MFRSPPKLPSKLIIEQKADTENKPSTSQNTTDIAELKPLIEPEISDVSDDFSSDEEEIQPDAQLQTNTHAHPYEEIQLDEQAQTNTHAPQVDKPEIDNLNTRVHRSGNSFETRVYENIGFINSVTTQTQNQTNINSVTMTENNTQTQNQLNLSAMANDFKLDIYHVKDDVKFTGNKSDRVDIVTLLDTCETECLRRNIVNDRDKIAILSSKISNTRCPASNLLKSDKLLRSSSYEDYKKEFMRKFSGGTALEGISPELHKVVDFMKQTNDNARLDDIIADVSTIKKTLLISLQQSTWVNDQNMVDPIHVVDLIGYIAALSKLPNKVLQVAKTIPYETGVNLLDYIDKVELHCNKAGILSSSQSISDTKTPETIAAVKQTAPTNKQLPDQRQSRPLYRQARGQRSNSRGNRQYSKNHAYPRSRSRSPSKEICFYCAHKGHTIKQCFIKNKEFNDKQRGSGPYCRYHRNVGHWTSDCRNVRQLVSDYKSGEYSGRKEKTNT